MKISPPPIRAPIIAPTLTQTLLINLTPASLFPLLVLPFLSRSFPEWPLLVAKTDGSTVAVLWVFVLAVVAKVIARPPLICPPPTAGSCIPSGMEPVGSPLRKTRTAEGALTLMGQTPPLQVAGSTSMVPTGRPSEAKRPPKVWFAHVMLLFDVRDGAESVL
jgi:hypothetical protein